MKRVIVLFFISFLCGACATISRSSSPSHSQRPSLAQLQQFAQETVTDLQNKEKEGTLSEEEAKNWKNLQKSGESKEMQDLQKHIEKTLGFDFPIFISAAQSYGYSFEEIDEFLELGLFVKNPYCENEFNSYRIFQVLPDYVLADGCRKTSYDDCSTLDARIFMFPKQPDKLYFDNQILKPESNECSVYVGVFSYISKDERKHVVPVLMFLSKVIDKIQLESIDRMRAESKKEAFK